MSQSIIGCSVDGSIMPVVTGTKGIKEKVERIDAGHVLLTFDYPLAPAMYAVKATVTEPGASNSTIICEKRIDPSGVVSGVEVRTYAGGVGADLDFDFSATVFNRSP
jgi:hypothetical protein